MALGREFCGVSGLASTLRRLKINSFSKSKIAYFLSHSFSVLLLMKPASHDSTGNANGTDQIYGLNAPLSK
jgi:hypothetical protein